MFALIVKRKWGKRQGDDIHQRQHWYVGWFLFGLIPLYIKEV